MKKVLALVLSFAMILGSCCVVFADELVIAPAPLIASDDDITIIHTNDVHCSYLAYDKIATLAKDADILVDGGDAIQGGVIGTLSKGLYITEIMNYLKYDVSAIGNHEFDFGFDALKDVVKAAKFPYVCCNLINLATGEPVFDAYKVFEVKGKKIAFVGVDTPATFTQSRPDYFQDDLGNYLYSFCEGNKGQDLYDAVQKAVNAAKAEADYVIVLGHLGISEALSPWTVGDVIAHVSGIDAFIDAHSHSEYTGTFTDKDGKLVLAQQTGTGLVNAGKIIIRKDGTIEAELVNLESVKADKDATKFIESVTAKFDSLQSKEVAKSLVNLSTMFGDKRAVRNSETNIGDFVTDAYRYVLGADVAICNGGAIRADLEAGNITYGDIVKVHPFGKKLCLVEVSGQQIKDALELGVSAFPGELGGFLQVSGMTFTVDARKPSNVVFSDQGNFIKVDGEYRVQNILIGGKPLDLYKTYTIATTDYLLKTAGDGYAMFGEDNIKILQDEVLTEEQILINYITDKLGGVIRDGYAEEQNRIKVIIDADKCPKNYACIANDYSDLGVTNWYHDGVHFVLTEGLMAGVGGDKFNPTGTSTRAMIASVIYRMAKAEGKGFKDDWMFMLDYADTASIPSWAYEAVAWCKVNGIMTGGTDNKFNPNAPITREQFAATLYRFAQYMKKDTSVGEDTNILSYEDAPSVSTYAINAMQWACGAGVINGDAGKLKPQANATRAELATMLYRYAK